MKLTKQQAIHEEKLWQQTLKTWWSFSSISDEEYNKQLKHSNAQIAKIEAGINPYSTKGYIIGCVDDDTVEAMPDLTSEQLDATVDEIVAKIDQMHKDIKAVN